MLKARWLPMRHIDDSERRSRLAVRHGIHPAHRLADPGAATRAMTVLHATEAASVHLAVHARVDGTLPEAKDEKPPRTHWDMLIERRSISDLEELLAERLELLRKDQEL